MAKHRRHRVLIDKAFQTKYLVLTFIGLLIQTLIVVTSIFAPQIIAMTLSVPLQEKANAAQILILLHERVWPGIILSMILLSCLSIFVTHKIVGPVYRIKKSLVELTDGDLTVRILLRKGDELQDLADHVNLLADELSDFVMTLKESHTLQSEHLAELEHKIEVGQFTDDTGKELIAKIQSNRKHVEELLQKFSS